MTQEKAPKAYKNMDFLNSREARALRILSEYLEPEKRLREMNIMHTVVFFGSARIRPDDPRTGKYYTAAEELAYRLAKLGKSMERRKRGFHICTGGGPGIMEAANRGAHRAGAKTIGLNISLPFEQEPNRYISPELNFEFHYFFMRKLWFLYNAKALVVFPGGFGTLDELFEALTLRQTDKIHDKSMPILLYDRSYWESLMCFDKMVELGFVLPEEMRLIHFFDTPEEGMRYLKGRLEKGITAFSHSFHL